MSMESLEHDENTVQRVHLNSTEKNFQSGLIKATKGVITVTLVVSIGVFAFSGLIFGVCSAKPVR